MKKMKETAAIVMSILTLVSALGCSNSQSSNSSGSGTAASASTGSTVGASSSGGVIKMGLVAGVTGGSAIYAAQMVNGTKLAVKEINAEGGILGKQIDLIVGDDKSTPEEAVTVTQKMVNQDKVSVWLGTVSSTNTLADLSVTNKAGILAMAPIAAADSITETGSGLVFRNCANNSMQVKQLCDYIAKNRSEKKFAIIAENTEYGKSLVDNFQKDITALGCQVLDTEYYTVGSTDFYNQLTNLKQRSPQGVTICGMVAEGAQILKQAKELGLNTQFFSFGGFMGEQPIQLAGAAADGIIHTEYFTPVKGDPVIEKFVDSYTKEYGKTPDTYYSAGMYDAVYLVKAAIEKAKTADDDQAIAKAMQSINYKGVMGTVTFDEKGQANMKVWMGQVQNQKQVVIYRPQS